MKTLVFENLVERDNVVFPAKRLVVACHTVRDSAAVRAHLGELGAPPPETVPAVHLSDTDLVRQTGVVAVAADHSSGTVEPVVFQHEGRRYLTIGSDHTDRALEPTDVAQSKSVCLKPVGRTCIPLDSVADRDALVLRSDVDGLEYQNGTLATIIDLDQLLTKLAALGHPIADGDVIFCGTIPILGRLRAGRQFTASITGPDWQLELGYAVIDVSSRPGAPVDKPEIEFTDVAEFAFEPVPGGVDGLVERTLSNDPATGIATRMLRFAPGTDTSEAGVLRHDFWEEVYILEGEMHDLTLDEVFGPGSYASRPPGMPHGPWRSASGCLTFEVRYPAS